MALPQFSSPNDLNVTLVYTVPTGKRAVVDINIGALLACTAKIAITPGTVPGSAYWLEPGRVLNVGDTLERQRIALEAGNRVYVQTNTVGAISAQVYGIEETV